MATNKYFNYGDRNQQNLYESLVIESIQMYGQDVYYLPREIVNKDALLLDDVPSRFGSAYKVEMYIENQDGFEGEGDLFTKFGIELRDQANFVVITILKLHTVHPKVRKPKIKSPDSSFCILSP